MRVISWEACYCDETWFFVLAQWNACLPPHILVFSAHLLGVNFIKVEPCSRSVEVRGRWVWLIMFRVVHVHWIESLKQPPPEESQVVARSCCFPVWIYFRKFSSASEEEIWNYMSRAEQMCNIRSSFTCWTKIRNILFILNPFQSWNDWTMTDRKCKGYFL